MPRLLINSLDQITFINYVDILYCKSDNNYTQIYLVNGEQYIQCISLTKFYEELSSIEFIKISQSYLININFIKIIDKKRRHVVMINKELIPYTVNIKDILCAISN